MYKVIIVDDEAISRASIRQNLKKYEAFEVIDECFSGANAIKRIKEEEPDLVFLDMQLADMTGVEVLAQLPKEVAPIVIFVTAFDQDAIHIFDVFSFDYLIKPVSKQSFELSLINATAMLRQPPEMGDYAVQADYSRATLHS